jgi:hypothetical protein
MRHTTLQMVNLSLDIQRMHGLDCNQGLVRLNILAFGRYRALTWHVHRT